MVWTFSDLCNTGWITSVIILKRLAWWAFQMFYHFTEKTVIFHFIWCLNLAWLNPCGMSTKCVAHDQTISIFRLLLAWFFKKDQTPRWQCGTKEVLVQHCRLELARQDCRFPTPYWTICPAFCSMLLPAVLDRVMAFVTKKKKCVSTHS